LYCDVRGEGIVTVTVGEQVWKNLLRYLLLRSQKNERKKEAQQSSGAEPQRRLGEEEDYSEQ